MGNIQAMPSSILFVHQGYELYGSDRTLIQSVQAVVDRWPQARVTVLLPSDGPLRLALSELVDDVRIVKLAILRRASLKTVRWRDAGRFIAQVFAARRMMKSYDVVYINTVMVLDYLIASCMTLTPRLVHVHEIPTGVAIAAFSSLLTLSRGVLVFNSEATRRSSLVPGWQRIAVVWNGTSAIDAGFARVQHDTLNLLLIGRFNSWKGQACLLRAVAQLPARMRSKVNVRLVGGFFGNQRHFADELERLTSSLELTETVEILPFVRDPSPHYRWADIVVVPSIRPEPFGLVAIEGMAAGCCVIASNHGGLAEIVVDRVTGTLVEPGSVESLSAAIARYVDDPALVRAEGDAGRKRFAAEFDESRYKAKIASVIEGLA